MFPKFENSTVDMDFSFMGCFILFLDLNSDKLHYNNISSKGAANFSYII